MAFKYENFVISSDMLEMSEADFKAEMKKRFGTAAKKAKEIYKAAKE